MFQLTSIAAKAGKSFEVKRPEVSCSFYPKLAFRGSGIAFGHLAQAAECQRIYTGACIQKSLPTDLATPIPTFPLGSQQVHVFVVRRQGFKEGLMGRHDQSRPENQPDFGALG